MRLNEKQIAALENKGFKRWTKGTMDRLYINADTLGLEVERYKTGNVSSAYYRGERISNSRGREMVYAKTYIDIATGKLTSGNWTLEQDAQQLYDETLEELEEAEQAAETTETTDTAETADTTDTTEEEDQTMSNNTHYDIKEKIVKAGNSRVFNSWHENAGISMEDFLNGLRWLCDDPMTDGHLTRELGCIRRADSGYTADQLAIIGTVTQPAGLGLHRLTRAYDKHGEFVAFYDEGGHIWGGTTDCASINAHDRV